MQRPSLAALLTALLYCASARASDITVPGTYADQWQADHESDAEPDPREFRLINYFFSRFTATNQLADPLTLRGVSLGPIGIGEGRGSSTRVGNDTDNYYVEQRWIPVLTYAPWFVDGLAEFNAMFEVDFAWGVAANGVLQNQGGGISTDQVNIQTKNVNVSLRPTGNPTELSIIVGTQPVYDSIYDPTRTPLNRLTRTGYKLAFLATDAAGIASFAAYHGLWKLALFPMTAAQPERPDGNPELKYSWLAQLDYALPIDPVTTIGFSYWYLRDDSDGQGFVFPSLARNGPGQNSRLPAFTGVPQHNIVDPSGYVNYFGAHGHHNIDFSDGPFGVSGFVMVNQGRFQKDPEATEGVDELSILGTTANLELMWNWGKTTGDLITLEGMYSTGDDDLNDNEYTGAFTLNHYGLPGAVWFNHKTLILFPFTSTVSNYTGSVIDVSNQGYGLRAGILAAAWDLIPDKLNLKLGAAHAWSDVKPPNFRQGLRRGKDIGTEVNVELKYHLRYLMTVGVHAGYMFRGSFYEANEQVTSDPYALFTTFTWYGF